MGYSEIEQKLLMTTDTSLNKSALKIPSDDLEFCTPAAAIPHGFKGLAPEGCVHPAQGLGFSEQSSDCEFNFGFLQWLEDEMFLCFKCALLWKPQLQSWGQKDWHMPVRKGLVLELKSLTGLGNAH